MDTKEVIVLRETYFRGKRIDTGEWVESRTILTLKNLDNNSIEYFIPPSNTQVYDIVRGFNKLMAISGYMYQVEPESVTQDTGLTDVSGKRIFIGDIVKNKDGWIYVFKYGDFDMFRGWSSDYGLYIETIKNGSQDVYSHLKEPLEIIGNIFDNHL